MKNLLLIFCFAALASVYSCSNCNKNGKDCNNPEKIATNIEQCSDSDSLFIYADHAKAYAERLIEKGKDSEAVAYLNQIISKVETKSAAISYDLRKFRESITDKLDNTK